MFAVGHFPILTNSLTLQIFCNIDLYTHINISSMNASSFVYIDVVIICTMMSFYQQILHSFSCYNVLCIGNLTYAGHFAVCPSTSQPRTWHNQCTCNWTRYFISLISSSKRLRLHPYHDTIMAISCIAVYKGHQRGWNIVKICCFLIIVFYYSFEGRGNLLNVNLVREINDIFSYFISRK